MTLARTVTTTDAPSPVPHRKSTAWWTLGVPTLVLAAAGGLALAWRSELPVRLAARWGTQGVDGTSSFAGLVLPLLGGIAPFSVGIWAVGRLLGVRR